MIPNSQWVESSDLKPEMQESTPVRYHDTWRAIVSTCGILIPGGFSQRGSEGMMLAIKYTCESKIPFLGICLRFQLAMVEWARNVLDLPGTMSGEFDVEAKHPFVIFLPKILHTHMGSTMHLGLRLTVFEEGSKTWLKVWVLYGRAGKIWEWHQHQYKVNPAYVDRLQQSRLCFVSKDEKGEHMQVLALKSLCCIYSTRPTDTLAYTQTTLTLLVFKPTWNSAHAL